MEQLRKLCRACLESPGEVSIFRYQNTITKLCCCTPMTKIEKNNGLPEHLCKECLKNLNDAYKFYTKCGKSNKLLRKPLVSANLDIEDEQLISKVKIEWQYPKDGSQELEFIDDIKPLLMIIGAKPNSETKTRKNRRKQVTDNGIPTKVILPCKGKRKLKGDNKEMYRENDKHIVEIKAETEDCFDENEWIEEYMDETEDINKQETRDPIVIKKADHNFDETEQSEQLITEKCTHNPMSEEHESEKTLVTEEPEAHSVEDYFNETEEDANALQGNKPETPYIIVVKDNGEDNFKTKKPQNHGLTTEDTIVIEESEEHRQCSVKNVDEYAEHTEVTVDTDKLRSKEHNTRFEIADDKKLKRVEMGVKCQLCKQTLRNIRYLREHIKDRHKMALNVKVECGYCGQLFTTWKNIRTHILRIHCEKVHQCAFCNKRFSMLRDKKLHESRHTMQLSDKKKIKEPVKETSRVKCNVCGKLCASTYIEKHMLRRHTRKRLYYCPFCRARFNTIEDKRQHENYAHAGMVQDKTILECDHCGKLFCTKKGLTAHITRMHLSTKRPYQCTMCTQRFLLKRDLINHQDYRHLGERPHPDVFWSNSYTQDGTETDQNKELEVNVANGNDCKENQKEECLENIDNRDRSDDWHEREKTEDAIDTATQERKKLYCFVCPSTFFDKKVLQQHLDEHRNEMYFCDICAKNFKGTSRIRLHKLKHKDPVKDPCIVCGKEVSRRRLADHMKIKHGEIENVECQVCKTVVRNAYCLKKHMRDKHKKRQPFQCDYCSKTFTTKKGVLVHINRIHLKLRPFGCSFCGQLFGGNRDKVEHERRHTGERPHQCPLCDRAYAQLCNMKSHFKYNHRERDYKEAMEEFKELSMKNEVAFLD